jgi:hypothetical protein
MFDYSEESKERAKRCGNCEYLRTSINGKYMLCKKDKNETEFLYNIARCGNWQEVNND